jgi:hypothetical protein
MARPWTGRRGHLKRGLFHTHMVLLADENVAEKPVILVCCA